MYKLYKFIILSSMYTITTIKSEQWYPAKMIEQKDVDPNSSLDKNKINYLQDSSENRLTSLLLILPKVKNENNGSKEKLISATETIKTINFIESDAIALNYNKTINLNKSRRMRPKRKYLRNQGPFDDHRKIKKLHSKQIPKTKFLDVFHVVEFDHVPCTSSNGLEGICLPEYECGNSGGSMMGSCADGYGTCCVTQFRCNEHSDASTGWFTNPEFPLPSTDILSCALTLDKSSEGVTQIRLDFNTFELLPPTDGICQYDQFIISGQNINSIIPILCGINTGQHVYVEVGNVDGPIKLTFQTASSESRLFSIKIQQLTSSDILAAPAGCLQYYKEPQGYIESFNYRDTSDIVMARSPSYLNNLNYAICIERAAETCSVTYTNAGNMQILNYDIDGLPVISPHQAGVEILNCPSDWLLIAATRLCGDRLNDGSIYQDFSLNAPITDSGAGPIVVWFRSDESYVGQGFRLFYQQNSCNT